VSGLKIFHHEEMNTPAASSDEQWQPHRPWQYAAPAADGWLPEDNIVGKTKGMILAK